MCVKRRHWSVTDFTDPELTRNCNGNDVCENRAPDIPWMHEWVWFFYYLFREAKNTRAQRRTEHDGTKRYQTKKKKKALGYKGAKEHEGSKKCKAHGSTKWHKRTRQYRDAEHEGTELDGEKHKRTGGFINIEKMVHRWKLTWWSVQKATKEQESTERRQWRCAGAENQTHTTNFSG